MEKCEAQKLDSELCAEVKKCIQSASTLEDIETLAAQFKASPQQSLASKARAIPNLEATAIMCLEHQTSTNSTLSIALT